MSEPLHLLPGAPLPRWVESLEQTAFEAPWGPLAGHEHLFGFPPHAYIRWSVVPAAQEAELLRVAVSPETRRQGFARRLLEASEAFLRTEGVETLFLEVRTSNRTARALYEASDWTLLHRRKAYYGDGEDALIYRKQLDAPIPGP